MSESLLKDFKFPQITILCKVVDNFGDIGVVYRLAKSLLNQNPALEINLVVDDLFSFYRINSSVSKDLPYQKIENINIYSWNEEDFCYKEFSKNNCEKLALILECFQCGRPDWMEKILFTDQKNNPNFLSHIIMIDYLTGEDYSETFHKLKSLTRSAKVQKVNFMPGFTSKTGGLIIGPHWQEMNIRNASGNILFFSYDRNWFSCVNAINEYFYDSKKKSKNSQYEKKVCLARGKGFETFVQAYEKLKNENEVYFNTEYLDFLNQDKWDELLKSCSFLFIRGEESLSRACLAGIPFIWHAYPQTDEYQLVKMNALLSKLQPYFSSENFKIIENCWTCINSIQNEPILEKKYIFEMLNKQEELKDGFYNFSKDLYKNGSLEKNLLDYIAEIFS